MISVSIVSLPPEVLEQVRALACAARDPISAFIYDLTALKAHAKRLKSAMPAGVELYYAIKANSEQPILETLAPFVDGFEISSGGEIERVLECATRKPFVFSGPGKLDSELARAMAHQVEMIHLESLSEIRRVAAIARELQRQQPVLIRINPTLPDGISARLSMAGVPTPFGIDEQQLAQAVALVERSDSLILSGFHIHAMSHQISARRHQRLLNSYLDKWPEWRALASRPSAIRYLNVGGGMGVDYLRSEQFDWPALCRDLVQRLQRDPKPPIVRFEPGRFVTAFCGYYVMQVLDIKESHGRCFVVCRGGTHQFRLPVAQSHDHPVIHVPMGRTGASVTRSSLRKTVTVVGQLCTPKDIFARDVVLSDPEVGDILVLPLAGAYGYNISHADFLCHPRPIQIFMPWSAPHATAACH